MAAQSILTSVKKVLGVSESDTSFDLDIVMHINTAFTTLYDLGIGPDDGFEIEDSTTTWDTFLAGDKRLNSIRTYVYLKVRMLFDTPATSFVIDAMNKQLEQLEWRISVQREGSSWTDPDPQPVMSTHPTWWGD